MIEKKFVDQKIREFQIQEFISSRLKNVGHSSTKLQRTPLGEKITISTSHPGLVVGRKGDNIKDLTQRLKKEFKLENPQIEINEIENPYLDSRIVAERIAATLERFGANKFKGVGHKTMADVMQTGALGIEILISGKIPGSRARTWRFYQGYLKKCGDIALTGVSRANVYAQLKSGTVGVKVSIMPPDIKLPDKIVPVEEQTIIVEELKEGPKEVLTEAKEAEAAKEATTKKTTKETKPPAKAKEAKAAKEPAKPKATKAKEMKNEN